MGQLKDSYRKLARELFFDPSLVSLLCRSKPAIQLTDPHFPPFHFHDPTTNTQSSSCSVSSVGSLGRLKI